ncbi:50S ribosomal protein P1 [Natrinema versiforme]|uniref:Large ribosomal subunit protein P1 n=1 Tax=Natrinema versiforme TaxID=88724 RepID=A0A4P8WID5_9EURY|nr:50S ribosomal protein P1 [Natrinema versiforme]QCS43209.1 50S ribosomal protein P1 [Natrinema versiforme]
MEYVYAALMLHESDREISEENVRDVVEAAGVDVEESRVRALVAALEDVDIEEAIEETAFGAAAPAQPAAGGADASAAEEEPADEEPEAEEEPEDEEEDEDEGDASGEGLGELFG